MRTTVRIDDDLLRDLKEQARREKSSLYSQLNRTLRRGLKGTDRGASRPVRYREKPQPLGRPFFSLDKALTLAAAALGSEQI